MNDNNKNNLLAIIITVIIHVAVVLILVFSHLDYTFLPTESLEQEPKEDEITFLGGEYVMLGDIQQPTQNTDEEPAPAQQQEETTPPGEDLKDAGSVGEKPAPLVSTEKESPMKVEKKKEEKPKKSGPTKEELAQQEQEKKAAEAAKRTNSKVKNAFGKTGSGSGKEGSPNGNSSTGMRSGAPGVSGLGGYTLANWGRPSSPVEGKVVIRVRVNSRGKVIAASYSSGSGTAASNMSVRRSCENASRQSSFSVPVGAIDEAVGYITWRFE